MTGYRSFQSTPLSSGTGTVLGIISTRDRQPRQTHARQVRIINLYTRFSAALVQWVRLARDMNHRDALPVTMQIRDLSVQLRANRDNESRLSELCERAESLLSRLVQQAERRLSVT